jgi:hypothetical protein
MSKVVSLGSACLVKYNIDRFFEKDKTNFFDWLITDFKSVLFILKNIDNRDFLSKSNFTCTGVMSKGIAEQYDSYKIEHNIIKMISLHDISTTTEDYLDGMDDFLAKYNRRLDRLKNIISGNTNVHMVFCLDFQYETNAPTISNEDVKEYFEYINKINPNNRCFLHIVIPPKYNNLNLDYLKTNNTYVYYLVNVYNRTNSKWWTNESFNWETVFNSIKLIDNKTSNGSWNNKRLNNFVNNRHVNMNSRWNKTRRVNRGAFQNNYNINRYLTRNDIIALNKFTRFNRFNRPNVINTVRNLNRYTSRNYRNNFNRSSYNRNRTIKNLRYT